MSFLRPAVTLAMLCAAPGAHAQTATTTTLAIISGGTSVSTAKEGSVATLMATVTNANGVAVWPGQVNFCEVKAAPLRCTDLRLLATVQLSSAGAAVFNFTPAPGVHVYQAQFLGTHADAGSTSNQATLDVTYYYPTATSLAYSGTPGNYTLNATATTFGSSDPVTGSFDFLDASNGNYMLATTASLTPGPSTRGLDFAYSASQAGAIEYPVLVAADFNGDGRPDIAAFWYPENTAQPAFVQTLLGDGSGAFSTSSSTSITPVAEGIGFSQPVVADFNGDGKPDLCVPVGYSSGPTQPSERFQILLGNGDGTFTLGQAIPFELVGQIAVGDFNGDGIPDLAVAAAYPPAVPGNPPIYKLNILLGNGDGTFTAGTTIPEPDLNFQITVADFNGDGKADLAITDQINNTLTILLGNGDGTFTAVAQNLAVGTDPSDTVVGDFNQDGVLDLATLYNVGFQPEFISILLGKGDGTFTAAPQITFPASLYSEQLLIGDFDGDGKLDLAVNTVQLQPTRNSISILSGNGDGTFSAPATYPTSFTDLVLAGAVDFNGDGVTDLAVRSLAPVTYIGEPDPGEAAVFLSNFGPSATATAAVSGISLVGTGPHSVVAAYSGSREYRPSTSPAVSLTAEPVATTIGLATAPGTSSYGQQVVLTATISPTTPQQNHLPTGTMTFTSGSTALSTATVTDGVATLNVTSLPVGTDAVSVSYSGDTNFLPSTGAATQAVSGYSTTTTLATSANPAGLGQTVTLTASVTGAGQAGLPMGMVTFFDGSTPIGSAALNATAQAALTTSTLTLGIHTLTASYAGDAVFHPSTSSAVSEAIVRPDFTIGLSAPSLTVQTYHHTSTTVTLTSLGDFADNLAVACANLPAFVTCIFTPNPAALAGNGATSVSFYLDTDSILGGDVRKGPSQTSRTSSASPVGLALLLPPFSLCALGLARRRSRPGHRASLQLLLLLAGVSIPASLALTSCGSSQISPVPSATPGTYTIPITATGASTGIAQTAQLTLTVTP